MSDQATSDSPASKPEDQETENWYSPDRATFGDRVVAAREAAGMSQGHLARCLGVKKTTLVAWEDDVSEPRANKLSMMAGLLNVSIMWLLNGEGDGMAPPDDGVVQGPDMSVFVAELREMRVEMQAGADRLARLEKRMRQAMQTQDAT